MQHNEYNILEIGHKAEILWEQGKFFDERVNYGKCIWKYYLLFDFVVEVEYAVEGNDIQSITAFHPSHKFLKA